MQNNKIDLVLKISIIVAILLASICAIYYFVIYPRHQEELQKKTIETIVTTSQTQMQNAMTDALDQNIKSRVTNLRVLAEISSGGLSYKGICSDPEFAKALADIEVTAGSAVECNVSNDGREYASASRLKSDPNTFWCVDSTGKSESMSQSLGTATSCQ